MNPLQMIRMTLKQEIRNVSALCTPFLFYLMLNFFYPLGLPVNSALLLQINPMIAWISILLATFLIAEVFFSEEASFGVFEQYLLSPTGLFAPIFIKLLIKWLLVIFPMIVLSVFLNLLFGGTLSGSWLLFCSLLLGSPVILLFAVLMAAAGLSVSLNQGLLAMLTLPICLPVFIFGCGLTMSSTPLFSLYILAAIFCLSLVFLPFCICYLIKVSLE
jgi:heme exporter protein B